MPDTRTVAVAGKGGTGKTTLTALLVREMVGRGATPVLAVDADPNANLGELLGVDVKVTVGSAREDAFMGVKEIPTGWDKQSWIEYKMHEALAEERGFDLLVMGRPEGPGCYCYANNIFREYIRTLGDEYPWVIMDNEGGLEHLSRHTTRDVDVMLVVTDPTVRGVRTVERVSGLVDELGISVEDRYMVINRVPEGIDIEPLLGYTEVPLAGTIPEDPDLFEHDLLGKDIFSLADSAASVLSIGSLAQEFIFKGRS